jgi:hypothetical protein
MMRARRRLVAALAAAASLALPVAARADGDPASDVIISQNVFFSYTKLPESSRETLGRVVAQANRGGYTVRVALIGNRFDLGSVPVFWKKPQQYAKFLSQELLGPAPYTNRVLTVMPNGFGLSRTGKDLPADRRALDAVPSAQTRGEDIAAAGVRAVRQLAVLHGVKVDASAPSQGGGAGNDRLVIGGAALAVLALAAVLAVLRSRRARVA